VGLHQCPSERKGEGVPVRSLRVPSHVPSHPQTAAKVRGFSPIASGFTAETDWLLEESGFELMVPLRHRNGNGRAPAPTSIILRENAPLGERLGRYKAESDTKPRRTALAAYFRTALSSWKRLIVRGPELRNHLPPWRIHEAAETGESTG
jgi:hypothetical protein